MTAISPSGLLSVLFGVPSQGDYFFGFGFSVDGFKAVKKSQDSTDAKGGNKRSAMARTALLDGNPETRQARVIATASLRNVGLLQNCHHFRYIFVFNGSTENYFLMLLH